MIKTFFREVREELKFRSIEPSISNSYYWSMKRFEERPSIWVRSIAIVSEWALAGVALLLILGVLRAIF